MISLCSQRILSVSCGLRSFTAKLAKKGANRKRDLIRSLRTVVVLPIAPSSVADGEAKSNNHDRDRRSQHDENGPVQRPLRFLRRSLGVRITHGAALRKRRRCPKRDEQQQGSQPKLPRKFHKLLHPKP